MKTALTYGTASLALMVSLMGTAHAQDIDAQATVDDAAIQLVLDEEDDAEEEEQLGPLSLAETYGAAPAHLAEPLGFASPRLPVQLNHAPAQVPAGLLTAFNAIDGGPTSAAFETLALDTAGTNPSGVVTLRSVDPLYGDINPFYGTINPFYGNIGAFWGTINPFYGTINPFYGQINPFYGQINPFYGNIGAFWGTINPFYGNIGAFESQLGSLASFGTQLSTQIAAVEGDWASLKYSVASNGKVNMVQDQAPTRVRGGIETLISQAEAKFGAAYTAKTGKSFRAGFVADILARHGLNLADNSTASASLALDPNKRARFYLDWNDSLMLYSGIDIVDHWMPAINWTPAITQIQGNGADTIIGIIDGTFTTDADLGNNVIYAGGQFNHVGGHGAGVASLIAGAHDGVGVMGIAPNVKIASYNPFNPAGQTSWGHVSKGLETLLKLNLSGHTKTGRVSIVNLSLGEKHWVMSQGMANMLSDKDVAKFADNTIYVLAAGNDGVAQTKDINWDFKVDPTFIIVGATDPFGNIAGFSNRPGTACLVEKGKCHAGNELYMRTVVAPGTLLAVSDGQGGIMRQSGTSFAAPLVSGAIALLHDRWQWLANHPEESAEIIFRSARDLGAPGPDEVYGWGMLDVAASQSPLDFNTMNFKLYKRMGSFWFGSNMNAPALLNMGIPDWWDTSDVFFTGFENIGDTYRDFSIPASAFTFGKSTNALGRGFERLQDYVNQRFATWIKSGGSDRNGDGLPGFTEARTNSAKINGDWTLRYDAVAPQYAQDGALKMVHGAATLTEPSGKASFTFGHGQGAMALSGYQFGVMSDYDPYTGGANPVLGLASGEAFMQLGYRLGANTKVSVGYTENREEWDEVGQIDPLELRTRQALGDRPASALTLDIEQRVTKRVKLNAQFTHLNEVNALLGTQTATSALLGGGARTEAMTLSATLDAGNGFTFDISATGARSETAKDQLFTNEGAIWSTAGQFTATKRGILAGADTLRLSVAQPLQVEQGSLQVVMDEVINRETGEVGRVAKSIGIETKRRITGEAVYALPLTKSSEFGVFSRYVSAGGTSDENSFVVGGNFNLRF